MNKSHQIRSEKQLMLDTWQASGKSISSFCKEQNIAYHSFFYWKKKLSAVRLPSPNKFIELPSPALSLPLPLTEIIYPNGKRIVFHSLPEISILKQLTQ